MTITRRELGKLALAAIPATSLANAKPNSLFGGIQIGANVPYSFHGIKATTAEQVLDYLVQCGLSAAELRTQPIEASLGAPPAPIRGVGEFPPPPSKPGEAPASTANTKDFTDEKRAQAEALKKWRLSRSMNEFKALRKKYEDAGVKIQIVKIDSIDAASDEILDYCFQLAKAVGAYAISCEIPVSRTKRVGQFAAKHQLMVGYHGHGNLTNPEAFGRLGAWEQAFFYSKFNGANVDIGHFFASNGFSPVDWIKEHHARITHVHLKDRKKNNGPGMPWGEGDTPIKEVLQLMKAEKYKFQATIELEYKIPEGSNAITEIAKCVDYCRKVLA